MEFAYSLGFVYARMVGQVQVVTHPLARLLTSVTTMVYAGETFDLHFHSDKRENLLYSNVCFVLLVRLSNAFATKDGVVVHATLPIVHYVMTAMKMAIV